MARRTPKPEAQFTATLRPLQRTCPQCGGPLWIAYNTRRKVVTLEGIFQLRIAISQCHTPTCARYHVRSHPEEEGRFALPHGEFGLDIIALIGSWRFREHRSVPEMHQRLQARSLAISERAVTHLLHRYARTGEFTRHRPRADRGSAAGAGSGDPGSGWLTARCGARGVVGGARQAASGAFQGSD